VRLVQQSLSPIPEDVKGVLFVIEDRDIEIGVQGAKVMLKKNMQGYYLVHKDDLAAMVKGLRELKAENKKMKKALTSQ